MLNGPRRRPQRDLAAAFLLTYHAGSHPGPYPDGCQHRRVGYRLTGSGKDGSGNSVADWQSRHRQGFVSLTGTARTHRPTRCA